MADKYIAIIVEGGSERKIIDILLDKHLLKFNREDLLNEEVINERNAKKFSKLYLGFSYDKPIVIYRVLDSHKEVFKISKPFKNKVESTTNLYTTPEIEILFIIYFGDYDAFKKTKNVKPNEYCKIHYKKEIAHIKSPEEVYEFWIDKPEKLVETIKEYAQKSNDDRKNTLASLLR